MRGMLLGLAVMVLGGVARGEVVITNLASETGTRTGNTSSGQFDFSGPSGATLSSIQFKLFNSGSNLTAGTDFFFKVSFSGQSINYITPGASLNAGATSSFTLDLTPFNYTTNGSNQVLAVFFTDGNGSSPNSINTLQFTTSSSAPTATSGWSFVATSPTASGQNISFALSAVPEPGTLLLGGFAAACGGGGVWWRRKRKPQVAETLEPVTAV